MANLDDFTQKNRKHTGAAGIKVSDDSLGSGDRVDEKGRLRFNDTTDLLEYYNGTSWKSIDAPPVITTFSINGATAATSGDIGTDISGTSTIAINGSLFDTTGATVTFEAEGSGSNVATQTITRNSANLITVTVNNSDFTEAGDPYKLTVTNGSGLSASIASAINANVGPSFTNAADTNFNITNPNRLSVSIAAGDLCGATDPEGDTLTYSVETGSLPSGLTLNTSTGAITGSTSEVGSDTVSTFSIRVASADGSFKVRQFTITLKAPVISTYNSTGSFTYSVPSGTTTAQVLAIGGGGGGGSVIGGGGGAGGMVEAPAYPLTPGGSVPGNVGGGGAGQPPSRNSSGQRGTNTVFGNITAYGGGGGVSWSSPAGQRDGGSGGGGSHQAGAGGNSTQTNFSPVGGTGYANPGYAHGPANTWGGGGGGATEGGPVNTARRIGGNGRANNASGSSVTYAGGGGGAGHGQGQGSSGGNGGGGNANTGNGQSGTANRGSGGGGSYHPPDYTGGSGGSGIVIVSS